MHTRLNYTHPGAPPSLILSLEGEKELAFAQMRSIIINKPAGPVSTTGIYTASFRNKIALHIHAFHLGVFAELVDHFVKVGLWRHDVIVTTDSVAKYEFITKIILSKDGEFAEAVGERFVYTLPNRGRNVFPLAKMVSSVLREYDYVLHVHTKKSPHWDEFGSSWRTDLLQKLCGGLWQLQVVDSFFSSPDAGVLIPTRHEKVDHFYNWGCNYYVANDLYQSLLSSAGISFEDAELACPSPIDKQSLLVFPAGMMFWFRPKAIAPLMSMLEDPNLYPEEPIGVDGTLAHAAERLICHCCELQSYRWALIENTTAADLCDSPHVTAPPLYSVLRPYNRLYELAVAAAFEDVRWRQQQKKSNRFIKALSIERITRRLRF